MPQKTLRGNKQISVFRADVEIITVNKARGHLVNSESGMGCWIAAHCLAVVFVREAEGMGDSRRAMEMPYWSPAVTFKPL